MAKFTSCTVLLPVINETESLTKTVQIIRESSDADVVEFILIVCKKTESKSMQICNDLQAKEPGRFVVLHQTLPFLGGAMRDAFAVSKGSHIIMMASDLETDPCTVKDLIAEAKKSPDAITTTSRWIKGGGFEGYSGIKLASNFVFQKMFSLLYGVTLSDMTYGYRIFPADLVKSIKWEEVRHPFLFETVIKPLRLGVKVKEIPTSWKARVEGESQNTFFRNFEYFRTGLKTRFASKESLLK